MGDGLAQGFDLAGGGPRVRFRPELGYSSKPVIGPVITLVKKFFLRLIFFVMDDLARQTDTAVTRLESALAAEVAARERADRAGERRAREARKRTSARSRSGPTGSKAASRSLQLGPRLARLERQRRAPAAPAAPSAVGEAPARSGGRLRLRDVRGALPPGGVRARAPAAIRRAAAGKEPRRRPRLRTRGADRDAEGRGRRCLRRGDRPGLRLAPRGEGDRGRGQGRRRAPLRAGGRLGRRRRRIAPGRAPSARPA